MIAESAFLFIVLLFLILLYQAIEKQWLADLQVRGRAHDRTFWKAAGTPYDYPNLPNFPGFLSGHDSLELADMPDLSPTPPDWLGKYKDFKNDPVEGWKSTWVKYGTGWDQYQGEISMSRYGGATRSSWGWVGYPMVNTQDFSERGKIKEWFEEAYNHLLPDSSVDGLGLDKAPL